MEKKKSKKKKPLKKHTLKRALNPREEEFCRLYASDREFFANGTQSYIEAYEVTLYKGKKPEGKGNFMTYESVRDAAHKLLTNTDILKEINNIFDSRGLNDSFVDKQLEFVITQNVEFSSKVKAIAEYNKLKSRITDRTVIEHTFALDDASDEELDRIISEESKVFKKGD